MNVLYCTISKVNTIKSISALSKGGQIQSPNVEYCYLSLKSPQWWTNLCWIPLPLLVSHICAVHVAQQLFSNHHLHFTSY